MANKQLYFRHMVNILKFQTLFSFCSHKHVGYQGWNSQMLVNIENREEPEGLLQKQSYLGLPCLSRFLWQATTVQNFRKFTIILKDF